MTFNLRGCSILVTRPNPAGQRLCETILIHGGTPIHFPTIAIMPPRNPLVVDAQLTLLTQQDWVIFISPQSVYAVQKKIKQLKLIYPNFPSRLLVAAQGEGTKNALREIGFPVHASPRHTFDSESLLDLLAFQNVQQKKIAIIRGAGGRKLLGAALTRRGAKVLEIIAYRREITCLNPTPYFEMMKKNPVDVIVGSSFEGIKNLKTLCGKTGWPLIQSAPLIVMSERVKKLAENLDFKTIWVRKSANPLALLELIAERGEKNVRRN